jgi:hypothetical protein
MSSETGGCLQRYKWHIIVTLAIAVPFSIWVVFGYRPGPTQLSRWLWVGSLILLGAMVILLAYVCTIVASFRDSSTKLEEVSKSLERIGDRLEELCQSTRLSERAKAIAFRDVERASLQEAVMQKLNARDYDAAYEVIDEIARRSEYSDLAEQLRCEVERHRQSIRDEKLEPVIAQIERLLDEGQWSKAAVHIEGLIKTYPDSELAKSMRQRLYQSKEGKKKALLSAWDDAVKRQDTDRSLEILKDLDMYLTHNEALALQEAAKDVFRNKLHNLGVRFSIAVSDRHWSEALDVGQQIITEFPNSRMSEEIRGRLDILKQNVQLSV